MNKINSTPAAAAPTLGPAWAQVPAPLGQKPRNKNKISIVAHQKIEINSALMLFKKQHLSSSYQPAL